MKKVFVLLSITFTKLCATDLSDLNKEVVQSIASTQPNYSTDTTKTRIKLRSEDMMLSINNEELRSLDHFLHQDQVNLKPFDTQNLINKISHSALNDQQHVLDMALFVHRFSLSYEQNFVAYAHKNNQPRSSKTLANFYSENQAYINVYSKICNYIITRYCVGNRIVPKVNDKFSSIKIAHEPYEVRYHYSTAKQQFICYLAPHLQHPSNHNKSIIVHEPIFIDYVHPEYKPTFIFDESGTQFVSDGIVITEDAHNILNIGQYKGQTHTDYKFTLHQKFLLLSEGTNKDNLINKCTGHNDENVDIQDTYIEDKNNLRANNFRLLKSLFEQPDGKELKLFIPTELMHKHNLEWDYIFLDGLRADSQSQNQEVADEARLTITYLEQATGIFIQKLGAQIFKELVELQFAEDEQGEVIQREYEHEFEECRQRVAENQHYVSKASKNKRSKGKAKNLQTKSLAVANPSTIKDNLKAKAKAKEKVIETLKNKRVSQKHVQKALNAVLKYKRQAGIPLPISNTQGSHNILHTENSHERPNTLVSFHGGDRKGYSRTITETLLEMFK